MTTNEMTNMERYIRQTALPQVGERGQQRLRESRVLVVGAGGLGCPVIQYLAAAGMGTLHIADGDTVSLSNLHRQILFTDAHIGLNKAEVAARNAKLQNPDCHAVAHPFHIDPKNACELIGDCDVVVDCTDDRMARYLINDVCVRTGKPFVHGSIHRFEGQVAVLNHNGGPTYRCLYPQSGTDGAKNCAEAGVLGALPGVVGSIQAAEALKLILGAADASAGRLLMIDLLHGRFETIEVLRDEAQVAIARISDLDSLISPSCLTKRFAITPSELENSLLMGDDWQFLDVRNTDELPIVEGFDTLRIPLGQLRHSSAQIDPKRPVLAFCKSGQRSTQTAQILSELGFAQVRSLQGGADSLNAIAAHIQTHSL